jgi:predicted MFS family arabinose efflux permease
VVPQRGRGRAHLTVDGRRLVAVQGLRGFVYGLGSVLVGVTLERRGLSTAGVGLVLAAMLAGSALATLLVGRYADRIGRRRAYLLLLVAMGVAGTVFALTAWPPALAVAALTGTLSTDVIESGPFASLEQAMLPHATDGDPARAFGIAGTTATLAGSLGALAAGGPTLLDVGPDRLLLAYPAAAAAALLVTAGLSPRVEVDPRRGGPLASRRVVRRLAGLFALDSFAGGFVVQAFIAFWFARRFGTEPETLGAVFFAVGLLQAASFQAAVRLAGRIGLLRTMVFTHLPSNVLLATVPFAPTERAAIALLLARFALSQMDVPARQAYVVALVHPSERTAAAATTNGARLVVRPLGPLAAVPVAQLALGAPFVVAGALKVVYDLALWARFRHISVRAPEPRAAGSRARRPEAPARRPAAGG